MQLYIRKLQFRLVLRLFQTSNTTNYYGEF
jgi:hypothetical protein